MKKVLGIALSTAMVLAICVPVLIRRDDKRSVKLAAFVRILGLTCAVYLIISFAGG